MSSLDDWYIQSIDTMEFTNLSTALVWKIFVNKSERTVIFLYMDRWFGDHGYGKKFLWDTYYINMVWFDSNSEEVFYHPFNTVAYCISLFLANYFT